MCFRVSFCRRQICGRPPTYLESKQIVRRYFIYSQLGREPSFHLSYTYIHKKMLRLGPPRRIFCRRSGWCAFDKGWGSQQRFRSTFCMNVCCTLPAQLVLARNATERCFNVDEIGRINLKNIWNIWNERKNSLNFFYTLKYSFVSSLDYLTIFNIQTVNYQWQCFLKNIYECKMFYLKVNIINKKVHEKFYLNMYIIYLKSNNQVHCKTKWIHCCIQIHVLLQKIIVLLQYLS